MIIVRELWRLGRFKTMGGEVMVMGDLVLMQDEIALVMTKLVKNDNEITAAHAHKVNVN